MISNVQDLFQQLRIYCLPLTVCRVPIILKHIIYNDVYFLTVAYLLYLTDKPESAPVPAEDKDSAEHESTKAAEHSEVIEISHKLPSKRFDLLGFFFNQQFRLSSQTSKESESYPEKTRESEEAKSIGAEQKPAEDGEKNYDSPAESEPSANQTQPASKQTEQPTNQTAPTGENRRISTEVYIKLVIIIIYFFYLKKRVLVD